MLLRKEILKRFPDDQPGRYIEPFGGAGWVLFASDCHAPLEVFNDFDGELINLFRCMKHHRSELQKEIRWLVNARESFEDCKAQQTCRGFTDIQRAAQYYTLIKLSYGSDVRTYGGTKKNLTKARDYLAAVQQRLESVRIEHKDFEALIKQYDRKDALFYLDPPYHGTEKYYDEGFNEDDHRRLKGCLSKLGGRFILSYNDDTFVRELYADYHIEEISRANNMAARHAEADHSYRELIIRNYVVIKK